MSGRRRRDYGSGSISQRKDGTWTARVVIGTNDNGTPKIKALYGKTEREVRKKLKEFQNELHKNDRIVVQKSTVESYMLNWLHSVKSNELKPKSFDRLEQTIKYQVVPYIGSLQVGAINADDVQKMLNDLKKEGKSYSTIKKAYDAVNECFRTGMIKKTVASNPVLGVSVPAKKTFAKTKVKCYTKEESEKLCQAAAERYKNGKPIYRLGGVVKLALNSGLRLGELLGLRWEDVSFDNRTITVAQTIVVVKNRDNKSEAKYLSVTQDSAKTQTSERTIYMNDEAFDALTKLYAVTGQCTHVLSDESGKPIPPRYLDRLFRKIAVAAGFPEDKIYGLHSLRHTFASRLFENGVDVKTVSEILGHSDVTITYNTYIHLIAEQKKSAIASLNAMQTAPAATPRPPHTSGRKQALGEI